MKKLRCCIIFSFLLCLFLSACHDKPDAIDSHGNPIHLSDYHGKWLVVNYWATWCKPCLVELPELNALYLAHQQNIGVLGVSFDGLSALELQQVATSLHLTLPLLSNFPLAKFGVQEIPSLPVTLLITPEGKLHKVLYGPQTQASLLAQIQ